MTRLSSRTLRLLQSSGVLRTYRTARRAGCLEGVALFVLGLAGVALPFAIAMLGGAR